jgi:hypothetical protein
MASASMPLGWVLQNPKGPSPPEVSPAARRKEVKGECRCAAKPVLQNTHSQLYPH